jgi:hypothetical protein
VEEGVIPEDGVKALKAMCDVEVTRLEALPDETFEREGI